MAVATKNQLATDERVIEHDGLETALEQREKKRTSLGGVRKEFKESDERARALLAEHADLGDGDVVRVGRFRITRSAVPSRSVSFDTDPTSRIRIKAVDTE